MRIVIQLKFITIEIKCQKLFDVSFRDQLTSFLIENFQLLSTK